jgi:hypothetical protein
MDPNIHKLLTDKLYDKRKNGAFEYVTVVHLTQHETHTSLDLNVLSVSSLPTVTIPKSRKSYNNFVATMPTRYINHMLEMEV